MIKPPTYQPTVRRPKGMQPLVRPAMSIYCDVCGYVRIKRNHSKCSKARQAAGFITVQECQA